MKLLKHGIYTLLPTVGMGFAAVLGVMSLVQAFCGTDGLTCDSRKPFGLVFCSALWVAHSEVETESSAECDATLTFSSEITSLTEGNGDIHSRSLSPWNWTPNTERNRIPRTLWEAECSTSFCSSPIPGQKDQHNLNSVPVYQDVLVLTSHNGRRCYKASFRSVAVGCTCVRAKTNRK